jgi:hypothetical protein
VLRPAKTPSGKEVATPQRRRVKIGARVVETAAHIRIAFASACPDKTLFVEVLRQIMDRPDHRQQAPRQTPRRRPRHPNRNPRNPEARAQMPALRSSTAIRRLHHVTADRQPD